MFIPRSLSKKAPLSSETRILKPSSLALPPNSGPKADSVNPKKRTFGTDEGNVDEFSTRPGNESSKDGTSQSESESDADSTSDSGDKPKAPSTGGKLNASKSSTNKPSGKQQPDQSEIAARLELVLSDVSLWRNESLYQRLTETSEWYIPFSRLHDHPFLVSFLGNAGSRIPDATLVNALRTYGSGIFEFRMIMRAPSNAAWKGKARASDGWVGTAGGYEVRCKAWASREEGWMERLSAIEEHTWHARMVYIERAPLIIRSVWTLYHFITALVRQECPNEDATHQAVQDILIPTADLTLANHPPEATRRFRGQAFVVFTNEQLAQAFCKRWSWSISRWTTAASTLKPVENWSTSYAAEVAESCGLRAISKADWDKLKAEYLEYQTRVLKQAPRQRIPTDDCKSPTPQNHNVPATTPAPPKALQYHQPKTIHYPPPFPPGILVFVRHLHPETNKTTLKTLFGRAFRNRGDAIEYLDFQKGIDSAHVRFRNPDDATTLANYFSVKPLTQCDGLDDQGQPTEKNPIEAEVVLGTREANYWAKVPEKVRIAAVAKAGLTGNGNTDGTNGDGSAKSRRKRQRNT